MSDWGADDYTTTIEDQPVDVHDAVASSQRARTTTRLDDARDALADAEGVLRVAEAKAATDFKDDETKAP